MADDPEVPARPSDWDSSCELSSNRTAMSFERTLMSSAREPCSGIGKAEVPVAAVGRCRASTE
jgi:hypothetical protein